MTTGSDGVNWTLFTNGNFGRSYTHSWFGSHEFTPRLTAWGSIQPSPHRRIFFHNCCFWNRRGFAWHRAVQCYCIWRVIISHNLSYSSHFSFTALQSTRGEISRTRAVRDIYAKGACTFVSTWICLCYCCYRLLKSHAMPFYLSISPKTPKYTDTQWHHSWDANIN